MQMTQLTAEVKKTAEACGGIAYLANDVRVLTASFHDVKEQMQLVQKGCSAEASKAEELASTLQDTCRQIVSEMQLLSAQVTSIIPQLQQQSQTVGKGVQAGVKAQQEEVPAPAGQHPSHPSSSAQPHTSLQEPTSNTAPQPREHKLAPTTTTNHQSPKSPKIADSRPKNAPAQPSDGTHRSKKRPRAQQDHAEQQDREDPISRPSVLQHKMLDGEPDIQSVPWRSKARPSRAATPHTDSDPKKAQAPKTFKRQRTPSKATSSSISKGGLPGLRSPSPPLQLTLQPLKPSSMQVENKPAGGKASLPASGRTPVQAAAAGDNNRKNSSGRHKTQQQFLGLDVFTKLFARADVHSPEQGAELPVIQEDEIAKEVAKRIMMQRMRRMQI